MSEALSRGVDDWVTRPIPQPQPKPQPKPRILFHEDGTVSGPDAYLWPYMHPSMTGSRVVVPGRAPIIFRPTPIPVIP